MYDKRIKGQLGPVVHGTVEEAMSVLPAPAQSKSAG
jgi:hypothetical protein